MELSDFAPWILAIFVAVFTQLIAYYFSKKNLEAQLEHNSKTLKMQLFHEDRKKALIELNELLMKWYKTYPEFTRKIRYFLNGKSGIFLPEKLRKELEKEMQDIDDSLKLKELELYEPEPEDYLDDYERWIEVSPEEEVDMELKSRLGGLKRSMRDKIKKYASEE